MLIQCNYPCPNLKPLPFGFRFINPTIHLLTPVPEYKNKMIICPFPIDLYGSTGGQILAGAGVIFSKCQSRLWGHSFKMPAPELIFENAEARAGSGECFLKMLEPG